MSEAHLIATLNMAVAASPRRELGPNFADWADIAVENITAFHDALNADPTLGAIWGKWLILPSSGSLITSEAVAIYLTGRARNGLASDVIIRDLLDFARTGVANYVQVRVVNNVSVSASVTIGQGVRLVPSSSLPRSSEWDIAFGQQRGLLTNELNSTATSAMIIEKDFVALSDPPKANGDFAVLGNGSTRLNTEKIFDRAHFALVTVGSVSPRYGPKYEYIRNPGWPGMLSNGVSSSSSLKPPPRSLTPALSKSMQIVCNNLGDRHPTLGLAASLLAKSRDREDPTERAIDLGSCLEMLLMHGTKADNSEITNKISHRGAWLLGHTPVERKEIFKTIRQAYSLRSRAVHEGSLPVVSSMEDYIQRQALFESVDGVCANLIIRLLSGWPDWTALTLGDLAHE